MHFADPDHRDALDSLLRIRRLRARMEEQRARCRELIATADELIRESEHLLRVCARGDGPRSR